MAKFISNKERQRQLDKEKWLDSEKHGKDMCGEYPYCSACDKSVEYPCARAFNKHNLKR